MFFGEQLLKDAIAVAQLDGEFGLLALLVLGLLVRQLPLGRLDLPAALPPGGDLVGPGARHGGHRCHGPRRVQRGEGIVQGAGRAGRGTGGGGVCFPLHSFPDLQRQNNLVCIGSFNNSHSKQELVRRYRTAT